MGQPLSVGLCLLVVVVVVKCQCQSVSVSPCPCQSSVQFVVNMLTWLVPVDAYCSLLHDGCDSWWSMVVPSFGLTVTGSVLGHRSPPSPNRSEVLILSYQVTVKLPGYQAVNLSFWNLLYLLSLPLTFALSR